MKREVIRVEPLSTFLERWKAPTSAVTRSGDTIYVSGFPPFDPDTGEVVDAPIERQTLTFTPLRSCTTPALMSCASKAMPLGGSFSSVMRADILREGGSQVLRRHDGPLRIVDCHRLLAQRERHGEPAGQPQVRSEQ
jgi:hypothetical protein